MQGRTNRISLPSTQQIQLCVFLQAESERLKCPITLKLLEDPVRSLCSHVFSSYAIRGMMRPPAQACKCPVPGCNQIIPLSALRVDEEMAILVQRHKRVEETGALSQDNADAEMVDDD